MTRLIIAGSRAITPTHTLMNELFHIHDLWGVTEIVSGGAKGVDSFAKEFAVHHGIKFTEFPADWEKHGKAAGPIRNKQMADYADQLLLIWDGSSRGSFNMKNNMVILDKPIYEEIV